MTAPETAKPPLEPPGRAAEYTSRLWTVPNVLSLLRIALVPVFAALMLGHEPRAAFYVFLVAGTTDVLDGFVARTWHQRSKIGLVLDPAADKLMMTTAFILLSFPSLAAPNVLPLWLVAVSIGRDIVIVTTAFILSRLRGIKAFPPSTLGKTSTICQVLMIWLVLIANVLGMEAPNLFWVYLLSVSLAVVSAVDYGVRTWRRAFAGPAPEA
ncbi:MAG: CDP-alcohol phosphatidyltransferase family protein [Candidatus Aminicenantes bacterium]|nr:CDP-alcohol phosphatidyltransferase family protein [Candidatus Aminicenantes bacterium]